MQKVNERDLAYRQGDSGPKYLFRGPLHEWGLIRLLPGQSLGPHYHQEVEETFFFLKGDPLMIVEGMEHRVKQGDAFRLEAMEKHDIHNDTKEAIELVFIKAPCLPEDKVSC
jgi:mannose-6-phosphate isomerase-like protein (cupin superfamily)